jgi:hypothetical protein
MDAFYLALFDARRVARDVELSSRHRQALPPRRKGRFGRRRRAAS